MHLIEDPFEAMSERDLVDFVKSTDLRLVDDSPLDESPITLPSDYSDGPEAAEVELEVNELLTTPITKPALTGDEIAGLVFFVLLVIFIFVVIPSAGLAF